MNKEPAKLTIIHVLFCLGMFLMFYNTAKSKTIQHYTRTCIPEAKQIANEQIDCSDYDTVSQCIAEKKAVVRNELKRCMNEFRQHNSK